MDIPATEPTAAAFSAIAGNLSAATGGAAPHQALRLMRELAGAATPGGAEAEAAADPAGENIESPIVAAIEAAIALAPRDPLEGMLVAQMAAVHAAAMRCLGRAAECAEYPRIEALYLREAARMLHLFQRQTETLDRRSRRFGPPKEDAAAANAEAAPDGREVLEKLLADLDARVRERKERERDAQGDAGDGGEEADARGQDP